MKLVRNLLLLAALILGGLLIKQKYFPTQVDEATQTEQTTDTPAEENSSGDAVADAVAEAPVETNEASDAAEAPESSNTAAQ